MPENDQYPAESHGAKLPVAVLLAAVVAVAVGVFAFAGSNGAADPTITGGIPTGMTPAAPVAQAPSSP